MAKIISLNFDLTPPDQGTLQTLAADLREDERQVLLEHGTKRRFAVCF